MSNLPNFEGRPGIFLAGTVSPKLAGVTISAFVKSPDNEWAPLSTVKTDNDGRYSIGPLYDDKSYKVV